MTDLISLLGTLVSPQGDILVKWVDEMVDAPDADEMTDFAPAPLNAPSIL